MTEPNDEMNIQERESEQNLKKIFVTSDSENIVESRLVNTNQPNQINLLD